MAVEYQDKLHRYTYQVVLLHASVVCCRATTSFLTDPP